MTGTYLSCARIRRSVSRPSMPGISTSRVTTSGRSVDSADSACAPLLHWPATVSPGSVPRTAVIMLLATAESSTTSTETLMPAPARLR